MGNNLSSFLMLPDAALLRGSAAASAVGGVQDRMHRLLARVSVTNESLGHLKNHRHRCL